MVTKECFITFSCIIVYCDYCKNNGYARRLSNCGDLNTNKHHFNEEGNVLFNILSRSKVMKRCSGSRNRHPQ